MGGKKNVRMMSTFIREIQAPVSDLCGLKSIMADIPEESPIYHHAKSMNVCGVLLADMIQNMKLYYMLSSDMYEVEKSLFVLRTEMEFVWDSLINESKQMSSLMEYSAAERGNVEIRLQFTKDVPAGLVESDSSCVLKIFKSLVENAIRFTLEGVITVEVFSDFTSTDTKHGTLHIVVSDTGVGIPVEARDAVFEPLTKAHAESVGGGAGMGLAVSRCMCNVLGGDLFLEEKGSEKGSAFHAWFPFLVNNYSQGGVVTLTRILRTTEVDYSERRRDTSTSILDDLSGDKGEMPDILLVEDVQLIRTIVARMMSDVHVVLSTAVDGLEAVEACREKKFDVILMDISMPNMGGIEATKEIKNKCPFNKDTPIIALTGTNAGIMRDECLKVGMVECVTKPVRRAELVRSIAGNVQLKHREWMAAK